MLETLYLSLDPTNRIWMSDMRQYMPPVALDAPMRGGNAGRVVASKKAGVKEGDLYFGLGEFADYVVTDGKSFAKVDLPKGLPLSVGFGVFGLVGPTAYFGLLDIGKPKAGETLVVSAASGGVGQIVGQIGKIKGLNVIGIAGGPEKVPLPDGASSGSTRRSTTRTRMFTQASLDALAPEGRGHQFRASRRPDHGGGDEPHEPLRPHAALRHDLRLQRREAGSRPAHLAADPDAAPHRAGLHHLRLHAPHYDEMFRELGGWIADGRR